MSNETPTVWAVVGDTEFGPTLYLTTSKEQAYKEACDYIAEALEGSFAEYHMKWGDTPVTEDVGDFFSLKDDGKYEKAYRIAYDMDCAYEHLGRQMWSVEEAKIHQA